MGDLEPAVLRNSLAIERARVPQLDVASFLARVREQTRAGHRISALFGVPAETDKTGLMAVLADDRRATLSCVSTLVAGRYPSLAADCPQAHLFEREIAEQWGVVPEGHPWLKPVRFHAPYGNRPAPWETKAAAAPLIGLADFFRVEGEEVHEVGVGPVHAGVIEPGHFRFQCHGEEVFHLEISLGFQHRGAERTLIGGPNKRTIHTLETVSGDTSIGHATAYCQAVEALAGCQVPIRAEVLRGIALELERLANHTGDLGALAGDVGFLPTASFCGRLRGDFLNLTALLCGNRFGRSLVCPGGVAFDLEADRVQQCLTRLDAAYRDVDGAANLLWNSSSVQARFEETGVVSREHCLALGMVGPSARACGVERDVRHDFPSGIFRFAQVPVSTWATGDVFGRAYVRWLEIQRSVAFIREQLQALPAGPICAPPGALKPDHFVISLVEGWRGEICHVAQTDWRGHFAHYKIVDPSFHNWIGLALALRNQQISDFPLCNKSFNLSYCGHDL